MAVKRLTPDALAKAPAAVILDFDDTLYAYAPAHEAASEIVEEKAVQLLGVEEKAFREAVARGRAAVKSQLGDTASSHNRLLYYHRAVELLGMKSRPLTSLDLEQTYWRAFLAHARLFAEVDDFVRDLRSAGIATAVLTDLTAQIQFRKLVYFGLEGAFDFVVTSEEAGADKPAFAPFRLVIDKLGVSPAEVWMIGDDSVKDIQGARGFGITALQMRRPEVSIGAGEAAPEATFDNFGDLRRLLRELVTDHEAPSSTRHV